MGQFPALRGALQDRQLPREYFGSTSVSDNIFDSLHRLLAIGLLAREFSVRETASATGRDAMHRDLDTLADALQASGDLLHQVGRDVRALHSLEHQPGR